DPDADGGRVRVCPGRAGAPRLRGSAAMAPAPAVRTRGANVPRAAERTARNLRGLRPAEARVRPGGRPRVRRPLLHHVLHRHPSRHIPDAAAAGLLLRACVVAAAAPAVRIRDGIARQRSLMRIAVFSTKRYDQAFLKAANARFGHDLAFLEPRLAPETAALAAGF